jgi:hypothetical protein
MKRRSRALFVGAAMMGAVAFAAPAYAGSYDGSCESTNGGEVCLYHYSNYGGAVYDTLYSKTSYSGSTFYNTVIPVDNGVASVLNKDPDTAVKLFTGTNYTGNVETVAAGGGKANLTYSNQASSHCFTSNAACP